MMQFYTKANILILFLIIAACSTSRIPAPEPVVADSVPVSSVITPPVINTDNYSNRFYLPVWIGLNTHEISPSCKIVLGISDPFVHADTANNQAMQRAVLIASLLSESKISHVKELYSKAQDDGKSSGVDSKFTRFQTVNTSLIYNNLQFEILDSCTSQFGEKVILMLYHPDSTQLVNDQSLSASIDVMQTEYSHRSRYEETKLFFCKVANGNSESTYRLYKNDETCDIESTFNQQSVPFKPDIFKYLLSQKSQVPDNPLKTKLYYGLWKAFFESLITQYTFLPDSSGLTMKSLTDNFGILNQSIDQQSQTTTMLSARLDRLYISENELTLEIEKTIP
jgi:hypothetical protein